ncbi:MAG: hypothetical protein D6675_05565 [Gemmatimonadetes bacterium]|nr:MAG: hypothetical protein D6675_05565 [Gemmatimonadota bacterium]
MPSFWDSVKKGLEEGVGRVRRGAAVAKEMTEETIKISKLRYSIHGLRNEIQATFAEIGGEVFEGVTTGQTDILQDEKILELIEEVKEFRARIEEIEAEIEDIRKQSGMPKENEDSGDADDAEDAGEDTADSDATESENSEDAEAPEV